MIDTNLAGDATTAADADFPPFPVWTPPESTSLQLSQAAAEELGRTIQSVATAQAQMDARLLELIGEFDAGGGTAHYDSIQSTTHWLAWACSMAPGTAREHVRVARALRTLPRTRQLLADGRLTYSKVRELTRIADLVDEEALCALALEMTASQLARTVRAYRAAPGRRIGQQSRRALSWHEAEDGTIRLSVRLPAEEAATIRAALDAAALDAAALDAAAPDTAADQASPDLVQALVDVAAGYLTAAQTELADDQHLVVVHVSADQLTTSDVPAGTPTPPSADSGRCFIEDAGPGRASIEPATAARLACTGRLLGALIDRHGTALAMGRTSRRATRAQRRALRIRDQGMCQFPGCRQTRHLDAHHIIPWLNLGDTDLGNLILLCRRHHVCCHEGGITIHRTSTGSWQFLMPDQSPVEPPATWHTPDGAHHHLLRQLQQWFETNQHQSPQVFPRHGGAGFSLHDCVRVLFDITEPIDDLLTNDQPVAA